jgi:His/Glu/Gln/Arg/opine family amino acid ABC transporter permease subunit
MMENYLEHIVAGVGVTLCIAMGSLLISIVLGLIGATCKLSRFKTLHFMADFYSTVVRGVPELVWMLFLFFGAQIWLNQLCVWAHVDAIDIDPVMAGIVTIGFIFGAYMTETFRGAILAIPKGQSEAARSLGMTSWQIFRRIVMPQMIPHALPSFSNNWMVLTKSTALVSVIGVSDLMHRASLVKSATGNAFGVYLTVCLVYLAITTASIWLLRCCERYFARGVRKAL